MYTEVSLVISLGLILILILTHFNFKSELFDFENKLKRNKSEYLKKINDLKNNIDTKYTDLIGPVDCQGEWKCNSNCIKTFVVDTLPKFGGVECPIEPVGESANCTPGEDYCPLY